MLIFITGSAGFIGYHLTNRLINEGHQIICIDNINNYYDIELKYARLSKLGISKEDIEYGRPTKSSLYPSLEFWKVDLEDYKKLEEIWNQREFDIVVNLAAQAGVRYSLTNPQAYIDSNIKGFLNILELCRYHPPKKLVYASSSSVYGNSSISPLQEQEPCNEPESIYAATKRSNELMAYSYTKLYGFTTIGLRFFTVYGPWGRPDMSPFLFTEAISKNKPINVFNMGDMRRDFTYIDDIIGGTIGVILKEDALISAEVFNIGNGSPIELKRFIEVVENLLGVEANKNYLPMQKGDVLETHSDTTKLSKYIDYKPTTTIEQGMDKFVKWYKKFYKI